MFGLLNIDKPPHITSREVVNRVQRIVRPTKVGHAGTLDPLATGVLVVCLGPATRLVPYIQSQSKSYRATFLLGRRSASDDTEEEVEILTDSQIPTRAELDHGLRALRGEIRQRPPLYSAVKIDGRRAYALARAGQQGVQVKERTVVVHQLEIASFDYPQLELLIRCGSGTYVRALGRDLARAVGTEAVMAALRRTAVGNFDVSRAVSPDDLCRESVRSALLAPAEAVAELPQLRVTADEQRKLAQGQDIRLPAHPHSTEVAAFDAAGNLVAILTPRRPGLLKPARNFPAES